MPTDQHLRYYTTVVDDRLMFCQEKIVDGGVIVYRAKLPFDDDDLGRMSHEPQPHRVVVENSPVGLLGNIIQWAKENAREWNFDAVDSSKIVFSFAESSDAVACQLIFINA